jgi:hypothetical protein
VVFFIFYYNNPYFDFTSFAYSFSILFANFAKNCGKLVQVLYFMRHFVSISTINKLCKEEKIMTQVQQQDNRKNRKLIAALVLIFAAIAITTGVVFAFFSDIITGGGSVTAGTLDITGSFTLKHYNAAGQEQTAGASGSPGLTATAVPNFNPGDFIIVEGAATNAGNKSAHIRGSFELTGDLINNTGNNKVKVVASSTTKTAAACAAATGLTPSSGTTYATTAAIINGSGQNAETETAGVNSYTGGIMICLPTAADNTAQGDALSIGAKIQAIQYRNNASPDWATVVSAAFGS